MESAELRHLQAQKPALVAALNNHSINTLAGLRQVERVFAQLRTPDLAAPMAAACR